MVPLIYEWYVTGNFVITIMILGELTESHGRHTLVNRSSVVETNRVKDANVLALIDQH